MKKFKKLIILIILLAVFVSCARGNNEKKVSEDAPVIEETSSEAETEVSEESSEEEIISESVPETAPIPEPVPTPETAPTPAPAPVPAPEPEPAPKAETSDSNGIRPEFKKMLDEYEAFFNEYCDFMVKYENSDDTLSMLADYTDFMGRYASYMQALSDVQNQSMNTAETKYYIEVNARSQMKLASIL